MKEPAIRIENGVVISPGADFEGYACLSEELVEIEENRYGIRYLYQVEHLEKYRKAPMCAPTGWFYIWEYKPNASVFYVRPYDSDSFNAEDVNFHVRVGKLAHGHSTDTLALMTTISEDAMDIIWRIGEIMEIHDMTWEEWPP